MRFQHITRFNSARASATVSSLPMTTSCIKRSFPASRALRQNWITVYEISMHYRCKTGKSSRREVPRRVVYNTCMNVNRNFESRGESSDLPRFAPAGIEPTSPRLRGLWRCSISPRRVQNVAPTGIEPAPTWTYLSSDWPPCPRLHCRSALCRLARLLTTAQVTLNDPTNFAL